MKYLCSSSGWLSSKKGAAYSLHTGKSVNAILGLAFMVVVESYTGLEALIPMAQMLVLLCLLEVVL